MANEFGTAVSFTKEKNVWILSARITFDQNGAAALDTNNSKGFCNVWQNTPTFTAGTNGSSSLLGSVSSFRGLFPGMNLTTGSSVAFIASATIGSMSAANALLGKFPVTAANNTQSGFPQVDVDAMTFIAGSGGGATGQYILQLGQALSRVQTWPKLLAVQHSFDETTGSASGGVLQRQLAPNAPSMVLIKDNTKIKTIPASATSGSTDASITVQFGTGFGSNFQVGVPAPGEAVRIMLVLGNSTGV